MILTNIVAECNNNPLKAIQHFIIQFISVFATEIIAGTIDIST